MIEIVTSEIDTRQVLASVQSPTCGASLLFCGTTRLLTAGKQTERLEYECYREMALQKIAQLCEQAKSKWPIENVSVVHRIGLVEVGQVSVAIAVASPHRQPAFEAGQWLIDELKREVPIWKREQWTDGSAEWIHPDSAVKTSTNRN